MFTHFTQSIHSYNWIIFQNAYIEHKEVVGAQGVKIAAKELEKAIAGLNLLVAQKPDEVDVLK